MNIDSHFNPFEIQEKVQPLKTSKSQDESPTNAHQIILIDPDPAEKHPPAALEFNKKEQNLISTCQNEKQMRRATAVDKLSQSFTETIKKAYDAATKVFRSNSEIYEPHYTETIENGSSTNKKNLVLKLAEKKIAEFGIEINHEIRDTLTNAFQEPANVENLNQSLQKAVNSVVERHFSKQSVEIQSKSFENTPLKRKLSLNLGLQTPELKIQKTSSTPGKFVTPNFKLKSESIEHDAPLSCSGLFRGEIQLDGSSIPNILDEMKLSLYGELAPTFDPDDSLANMDSEFFSNQQDPLKRIIVIADAIIEKAEEDERIRKEKEEEALYPPCLICFQSVIPKRQCKTPPCEHQLCRGCIIEYIQELIKSNKVLKVECPTGECAEPWSDSTIESLITPEEFKRYTKLKEIAIVNADPTLRWCIRPGCERYNKGNAENPHIICACGTEICFHCSLRWHPKKTCEQAMEAEYKHYVNTKEVQFCPSCKSRCEKDSGCNHMTCSMCTYQWCWLCRGAYSSNHYNPLNPLGCPGLQGGNHTRKKWNFFRRYLLRVLLLLLWILIIVIAPVALVFIGIGLPWYLYYEREHYRISWRHKNCCSKFGIFCFLILLGIVMFPVLVAVVAVLLVIPGTCFLVYNVGKCIRRRLKDRKRRLEAIANMRRRSQRQR